MKKIIEEEEIACRNKYSPNINSKGYSKYYFVIAAFEYLLALFLKSYLIANFKSIINKNFISVDIIIIFLFCIKFYSFINF